MRAAEIFAGNFSDYAAEKARRRDAQWAAYRRQQDHERRVRREINTIKSTASRRKPDPERLLPPKSQEGRAAPSSSSVASSAVSIRRTVSRSRLAAVRPAASRAFSPRRFACWPKACGCPPADASCWRRIVEHRVRRRVVIIGANGSGKTTLLTLVGESSADAGEVRRSPVTQLGYLRRRMWRPPSADPRQ